MGTIYNLTISFIVLLQIKLIRGEYNASDSPDNGYVSKQGSVGPNNFTNQEQTTLLSTSSSQYTNDTTPIFNTEISDKQPQNKHSKPLIQTTTFVPSNSSENKDNFNDNEVSVGNLTSSFNTTQGGRITPSTQSPSNQNATLTFGYNREQPNKDMVANQISTLDIRDSTQTTPSNQLVAEDKLEIFNITTERINSTCIYLMWEINQAGNFTFQIKPGQINVVELNSTRFKETVCLDNKPGKTTTFKINLLFGNETKGRWDSKKVQFEPSSPIELKFINNTVLSWTKGIGRTDFYELKYQTNNTDMDKEANDTHWVFEDLLPGETVNISLCAVRNFNKYDLILKSEPVFKEITIEPLQPVVKIEQNINSIDVLLQSGTGFRDGYIITTNSTNTVYNVTRSYMDALYNYTITNLTPAHYYDITVVSFSNGVESQPVTTRTSTCPQIHGVNVENITSTSFMVRWNGDYNDDTTIEIHINDTTYSITSSGQKHINHLKSTTVYSVDVTFSLNGCNDTFDTVYISTTDAYLKPIEDFEFRFKKSEQKLELNWKPSKNTKNTILHYVVSFKDLNNDKQTVTKTTKTAATEINATYGECYNITIAGLNKAGRGEDFNQYIYIPEDVPETVSDVKASNVSSRSVRIQWKKPAVFKGTIVKYTVVLNDSSDLTAGRLDKKTLQCDESCYNSQCLNNTRKPYQSSPNENTFKIDQDELEVEFKDFTPYHNYSVMVTAYTQDNESEPVKIQFMTDEDKPGRITKNSIAINVSSSDATIKWKPPPEPNGVILLYNIELLNITGSIQSDNTTDTSVTFSNLEQATKYSVRIKAKTSKGYGEPSNVYSFTTKFSGLSQIREFWWKFKKEKNQVKMSWTKPENGIESYLDYSVKIIDLNSNTTELESIDKTKTRFNVTYGECYNITIAGVNEAGRGEDFIQYIYIPEDVPETVSDVKASNVSSRSVRIQWKKPAVFKGTILKYTVVLNDSSDLTAGRPDKKTLQCDESCYNSQCLNNTSIRQQRSILNTRTFRKDENSFEVEFKDLTPYHNYSVMVTAYTQDNESEAVKIQFMTDEDKPGLIDTISIRTNVNTSDAIITWKPPSEPNGVILSYNIELLNITGSIQSENTTDTSVTFSNLQQVTEYSIRIKAKTAKGYGNFSDLLNFSTNLKVPSKPENVSVIDKTSTSVTLGWTQPLNDLNISHYVQVNDTEWNTEVKNVTCDHKSDTVSSCYVPGLRPYRNYSLQVIVANNKGASSSDIITTQTLEDKPGVIDKNLIRTDVSSSDAIITWKPPPEPNGVILSYNIELLNSTGSIQSKNTTDNSVTFSYLEQATEYSVRIKAKTSKGYGNFSDLRNFSTKLKVPSKPENVSVIVKTSTSVTLGWTQSLNDLNISHYVQVNGTVWNTNTVKNITCGHKPGKVSSCYVPGLRPYRNYSLQVIVVNNEGASSSDIITTQTLEDKPGRVSKFEANPEDDHKKPRTISLDWKPPNIEDRNGNIVNYVISYGPVHEDKTEIKIGSETTYVLRDVLTDVEYEIKLAAVTRIGTGVSYTRKVIVPSGILPKPIEVIPLIKHLPTHLVQEKQHQIPLQLPLGFLCNVSYGDIMSRGILASRGTRSVTELQYGRNYPSWYEAKDSKTLLTYQVSSLSSLKNCKYEEGNKVFIVGNDKECINVQEKYCNGNLQPDTIYRFKVYLCTKAGCTYSKFSYPIKTDKESNTVLLVIIGILIAIIIPAGILIFLLYRKKKACFAMSDGDGEKSDLDLRVYKSNRNRPVKLSNFEAHVQAYHLNTNFKFSEEYKVIKQLSPKYSTKAAERESCRIKNRYTNVLPFDSTRVKLLPVDDEEDSEYINANYLPGYNGKREYIAAQGPLPSTTDDYWRMLWENQVSVVVMLTQCMEKGREKCEKYWPDSNDPVYYGDLVVQLRSESNLPDYNIRVLDVKLGIKSRTIKQFHFLKWPDFGCPEKTWLLLNFVAAVRAHLSNSSTGPIVVHCSAGVGRTGTFIATDMLLQQIRDSEEIDIFGLVLDMRENRSLMVQTENQYIYIHDCIRDALIDDTDEEEIDEHIYENEGIYENT